MLQHEFYASSPVATSSYVLLPAGISSTSKSPKSHPPKSPSASTIRSSSDLVSSKQEFHSSQQAISKCLPKSILSAVTKRSQLRLAVTHPCSGSMDPPVLEVYPPDPSPIIQSAPLLPTVSSSISPSPSSISAPSLVAIQIQSSAVAPTTSSISDMLPVATQSQSSAVNSSQLSISVSLPVALQVQPPQILTSLPDQQQNLDPCYSS